MEPGDIDPIALDCYLAGDAPAEQQAAVEQWLDAVAGRREYYTAFRVGAGVPNVVDAGEMARVREVLLTHVRHDVAPDEPNSQKMSSGDGTRRVGFLETQTLIKRAGNLGRPTMRRWLWSASVVAVVTVMSFFSWSRSSRDAGITRTYTTGADQQATVTLSDGSHITLAPNTRLRLIGFGKSARTVAVDGDAYFEVAHASGAPFLVRSGAVTTQALGTAFFIHHTTRDKVVRVAVAEGRVRIMNSERPSSDITLTAGHIGEITDSVTTTNAIDDLAPGTEWLRGQLVFHHMPVSVVLQTLSHWYGYQFHCADTTLPQRNVTIGLSVRSSASALATLEQILSVNVTVVGDTVTLVPQPDQRVKGAPRIRSYDVWIPTREVGQ